MYTLEKEVSNGLIIQYFVEVSSCFPMYISVVMIYRY